MEIDSSFSDEEITDDPLPPHREQYLFLLEFFINYIESDRLEKFNEMFYIPTAVTLNFLNIQDESIEITPVDSMFEPLSGIPGNTENFFAGRSILFAIPEKLVTKKSTEFKIKLRVKKKMPDEIHSDILVGIGELDMSQQFCGLRKELLQCWHRDCPPPKIFQGPIEIFYDNELSGIISVLVRISGFGQSIVTEFNSPPEQTQSFIFKGDERNDKNLSYKCRIMSPSNIHMYGESNENLKNCDICVPKKISCFPCGNPQGGKIKIQNFPQTLQNKNLEIHEKGMICSSRGNPVPCGKAVVLKVSGLLNYDGKKKPTVTVDSESSGPDPDHDVFVLRIGKKGLVGADEKSDLQLEMRTPKGPERRPPIRYETRESQTEDESKNSKKKGGKGGKKKK